MATAAYSSALGGYSMSRYDLAKLERKWPQTIMDVEVMGALYFRRLSTLIPGTFELFIWRFDVQRKQYRRITRMLLAKAALYSID